MIKVKLLYPNKEFERDLIYFIQAKYFENKRN